MLEAVVLKLDPASQVQMRRQIASISRVVRFLDWTDISFYSLRGGKVKWPRDSQFPNRGEFELARARYEIHKTKFRTSIWAVSGNVFSFITRPSIKKYCFGPVEGLVAEIVGNPQDSTGAKPDLRKFLPPSYLEYWSSQPASDAPNEWRIAAPDDVHLVHLRSHDFVFLAQRDSDFLLANGAEPRTDIYISIGGDEPELLGDDFSKVLANRGAE